jgi:hypothetical protein
MTQVPVQLFFLIISLARLHFLNPLLHYAAAPIFLAHSKASEELLYQDGCVVEDDHGSHPRILH